MIYKTGDFMSTKVTFGTPKPQVVRMADLSMGEGFRFGEVASDSPKNVHMKISGNRFVELATGYSFDCSGYMDDDIIRVNLDIIVT